MRNSLCVLCCTIKCNPELLYLSETVVDTMNCNECDHLKSTFIKNGAVFYNNI